MNAIVTPLSEQDRFNMLREYGLLHSFKDEGLDQFTELAILVCGVPSAFISVQSTNKPIVLSAVGPDIPDAAFKYEVQLTDNKGNPLGVLGITDAVDRQLTAEQKKALTVIGKKIAVHIHSRRALIENGYYERLFEMSDGLVCITDTRGSLLKINGAFARILGWGEEYLFSTTVMDIVHPDDAQDTQKELTRLAEGHSSIRFQHRLRTQNGDYRHILWVATPEPLTNFIFAVGWDITKEKIREEELIASENNLRGFLASSHGMICKHDLSGRLIYVNQASADSVGYTPGELEKMTLFDIVPEHYHLELKGYLRQIKQQGKSSGLMHARHRNGNVRIWLFNNVLATDIPGEDYVIGNATDITERHELEMDLKRTKELLERTNHVARIGGWEFNLFTGRVWWSKVTKEIHEVPDDYEVDPAFGTSFYKEGESRERLNRVVQEAIATGLPWEIDLEMITTTGKELWVRSIGYAEFENGKCKRLYGTFQDIDAIKKTEIELRKATLQAEYASRAKSEFLANMSHEIRTPLNGVIGFTDLVLKTELNETQQQYLSIINQSANALLSIINDILDFSKIEAGKLELDMDMFDLYEFSSQASDILSYQAQQKGLEMLLDVSPELPRFMWADIVRLKQILVNLLGNAVKFTQQGEIELRISPVGHTEEGLTTIRFEVRDTGIGIPEDKQQKIFEAFLQEDVSTTKRYGGTGLGLTISNKLLALMGSKLQLQSEPGNGSCFFFDITVKTEDGIPIPWMNINSIKKVLIVDDNAHNRIILSRMLQMKDIETDEAKNGMEALQILMSGTQYDVILMDYHMPYMDGLETIRKIRTHYDLLNHKTATVLLHSSADDEKLIKASEELDVAQRLLKPIKVQELYHALSHLFIKTPHEKLMTDTPEGKKINEKIRILIAEDNPINMLLASTILRKIAPGAIIQEAGNGEKALAMCKMQLFDIIFMDIQMPEMNGYEATRQIRTLDLYTHVPIIALTAGNVKGEREKCIATGMNDFVTKPFVEENITTVLDKWLVPPEVMSDTTNASSHFDIEILKTHLGENDHDLIQRLLTITIDVLRRSPDELKTLYAQKDMGKLNQFGHKLRGTAMIIGLIPLADLSEKLENLKDFNHPQVDSTIQQLLTEMIQCELLLKEQIQTSR